MAGLFVLVLFSFRFCNLTSLPVFADEAIYIRWAQIMKAEETLRFLPLSDGKAPLYMWVVIPFLKVFTDPLFAGRLVSVLSGFGTLTGVAFLSYLLFKSKKASMVSALIYAVSPFTFFFDRMGLADSMLSMLGVWTFIFTYLTVTTARLDFAMLAGFSLGAAWLTKSPALFFTLLIPTLWIFTKNVRQFPKVVLLSAVTILMGFVMYNILRLGPNFHLLASRNTDYVYPLSHLFERPLDPLKVFLTMSFEWVWLMGTGFIFLPLLATYVFAFKKYWKQIVVLSLWLFGPLVVQAEFAKVFTARYVLFLIPYLIIISSSVVAVLGGFWKKFYIFVLVILVATGLNFNYKLITKPETAPLHKSERSGYLEEWTAGQGIKEAADFIRNEQVLHPEQKIVVGTEGYFGTLPDGLQIYLNDLKQITVIGVGLNLLEVPDQLTNSKKFGNKTYLLINDDRFKANADEVGLKLIASYDKAIRVDGTQQKLLLFELVAIKPNPKKH